MKPLESLVDIGVCRTRVIRMRKDRGSASLQGKGPERQPY